MEEADYHLSQFSRGSYPCLNNTVILDFKITLLKLTIYILWDTENLNLCSLTFFNSSPHTSVYIGVHLKLPELFHFLSQWHQVRSGTYTLTLNYIYCVPDIKAIRCVYTLLLKWLTIFLS